MMDFSDEDDSDPYELDDLEFDDEDDEVVCSEFDEMMLSYSKEKTISTDLRKYINDEELILKADELYRNSKTGISRQKQRIYLLFAFTLKAYRILYGPVDPNKIGKLFSLPSGGILTPGKQNTAVSSFSDKKENTIYYTSAIDLLPDYCRNLKIEDALEDITELGKQILAKDKSLMNVFPQTVAGGLIYYYLSNIYTTGDIDKNKLKEVVGRTLATIRKMSIIISEIDNRRS
jgi:hypothetical protein